MSNEISGYDAWQANFSATNGSGANQAAVPEPGSIIIAMIMTLGLLGGRRFVDSRR